MTRRQPRNAGEAAAATGATVVRDSAGLLVGTAINGLFAYIFFAQATRGLGAAAAAPVAVLWTYWGVSTAFITFPVQHWIIRTIRASGEDEVGAALPRMTLTVCWFALAAAGLSWLADEQLFGSNGPVFPALIGLVTLGSFFTGVVRGGLAGREYFGATAAALAADNILRVVLAAIVLRAGGGAVELGIVLVAGAFVGLVWPAGYRFPRPASATRAPDGTSSLAFLGAVAASSLLGQLVLVGGPAILAVLGGAPQEVTMLFATLAFFRAPYLLAIGIANRMTGSLTGWVRAGRQRQVRLFQVVVAVVTVGGGVLAAAAAYQVGPALVAAVFGSDTLPPKPVAALVAAGSAYAVGNLALSLLAIAQGRGARLTRAWLLAACVVAVVLVSRMTPPLESVSWAFLAGEVTAFVFLLVAGRHAVPAVEDTPESWGGPAEPEPIA